MHYGPYTSSAGWPGARRAGVRSPARPSWRRRAPVAYKFAAVARLRAARGISRQAHGLTPVRCARGRRHPIPGACAWALGRTAAVDRGPRALPRQHANASAPPPRPPAPDPRSMRLGAWADRRRRPRALRPPSTICHPRRAAPAAAGTRSLWLSGLTAFRLSGYLDHLPTPARRSRGRRHPIPGACAWALGRTAAVDRGPRALPRQPANVLRFAPLRSQPQHACALSPTRQTSLRLRSLCPRAMRAVRRHCRHERILRF